MARSTSNIKAPRRVIGYVRISKDRDDETSTTTQEQAIEAWCTLRGHQLVKVVREPGRSAYKASRTSRPGFREASQLVHTGAGDLLAVWKVDRACRNTLDLLQLVQELERNGAEFASVTEEFDTSTPMGKTMLTIVGALAEMESAQKSDRATEWHRHRRTTGAVPAGKAALGYRKPAPNTLEPDPDVAPLVAQAANKVDPRKLVFAGVVWMGLVTLWRTIATTDMGFWDVAIPLVVISGQRRTTAVAAAISAAVSARDQPAMSVPGEPCSMMRVMSASVKRVRNSSLASAGASVVPSPLAP